MPEMAHGRVLVASATCLNVTSVDSKEIATLRLPKAHGKLSENSATLAYKRHHRSRSIPLATEVQTLAGTARNSHSSVYAVWTCR